MHALQKALLILFAVLALCGASLEYGAAFLPEPPSKRHERSSQVVLDEDGRILRGYLAADGYWRLPVGHADVQRRFLAMLIAYEDRRFRSHDGIDWLAVVRASLQWLRYGRPVSGASTLTMQVARLLEPGSRTLAAKARQMLRARWLERRFSKDEILNLYLNLAPYGGNIEGVRAAALLYFGKEPKALDVAEGATLIALPQSPERRRPDLHAAHATAARDRVLARAAARGVITERMAAGSRRGAVEPRRRALIGPAPHLADRLRRARPSEARVESFLDRDLQVNVLAALAKATPLARERVSGAALVVRNRDGAVRAYVSGTGLGAARRAGHVDLVQAVRSPGSTLKPVIYGMGFERLIVHPETVITDAPISFSAYEPQNFSGGFQGDVTIREALIRSINTTAVAVLSRVGPDRLMTRLRKVGAPLSVAETDAGARLSIALGGGGMSLWDLATIFCGLARGGQVVGLRAAPREPVVVRGRLLTKPAAWTVSDILADATPPENFSFRATRDGGRRIAYKTGTSYGFRDAWAVGYDRDHTVAVWVGRPDGAPTPGLFGRQAAAPLLFGIFDFLPVPVGDVAGPAPKGTLLGRTRGLPKRLARFAAPGRERVSKLEIDFPKDGSSIRLSKASGLSLSARGGSPPYYWFVDDRPIAPAATLPEARWTPDGSGQFQVKVIDGSGKTATAGFWLD